MKILKNLFNIFLVLYPSTTLNICTVFLALLLQESYFFFPMEALTLSEGKRNFRVFYRTLLSYIKNI